MYCAVALDLMMMIIFMLVMVGNKFYLYCAVSPVPSCDTETGPVLTLPVQLAPEQRRGGQADGDQADAGDRAGE